MERECWETRRKREGSDKRHVLEAGNEAYAG